MKAELIPMKDHSMITIADIIKHVNDTGPYQAIAFEPQNPEGVKKASSIDDLGLKNMGHDILIVRYAELKKLPLYFIDKNDTFDNLPYDRIACIVDENNLEHYKNKIFG